MMRSLRRAGVSVPLFSLRSTRSWGIGEIGDIPLHGRVAHERLSIDAADSSAQRAGAIGIVSLFAAECDGHRSPVHQRLDDGGREVFEDGVEAMRSNECGPRREWTTKPCASLKSARCGAVRTFLRD